MSLLSRLVIFTLLLVMKYMSPVGWGQIHTLEFCLGTLIALQKSHTPARSPHLPVSVLLGSQLSTQRKTIPFPPYTTGTFYSQKACSLRGWKLCSPTWWGLTKIQVPQSLDVLWSLGHCTRSKHQPVSSGKVPTSSELKSIRKYYMLLEQRIKNTLSIIPNGAK